MDYCRCFCLVKSAPARPEAVIGYEGLVVILVKGLSRGWSLDGTIKEVEEVREGRGQCNPP